MNSRLVFNTQKVLTVIVRSFIKAAVESFKAVKS